MKKKDQQKTSLLINELSKDLKKVKVRESIYTSFLKLFMLLSGMGLSFIFILGLWFTDFKMLFKSPGIIFYSLAFLSTCISMSFALLLSIPGKKLNLVWKCLILLSLGTGLYWFVLHKNSAALNFFYLDFTYACAIEILVMSILPGITLFFYVRKNHILEPFKTVAFSFLSGLFLGLSVISLHCPIFDGMHLLLWHLMPIMLFVGIAYFLYLILDKK